MVSNDGTGTKVAVVIVNYRTPALALHCVEALAAERAAVPGLEAIVVDGGSGDGSAEQIGAALARTEFAGWASLLALEINGGFGWANNQAMLRLLQRDDPPDFIHLLNPDAEIEPGAVAALAEHMRAHPRCAAAGSRLLSEQGEIAGSAFRFPSAAREFVRGSRTPLLGRLLGIDDLLVTSAAAVEVDWVTGASVMLRAEALRETGLFDDGFFLYFEEVELMWRLRRGGWTIWHVPASIVRHVGGAATGLGDPTEKAARLPRSPAYLYQSRLRFFSRTRGTAGALAAGFTWLAGHGLWTVRRTLGLGRAHADVAKAGRDHLRHSLLPRRSDRTASVVAWNSAPGVPPAWMRQQ